MSCMGTNLNVPSCGCVAALGANTAAYRCSRAVGQRVSASCGQLPRQFQVCDSLSLRFTLRQPLVSLAMAHKQSVTPASRTQMTGRESQSRRVDDRQYRDALRQTGLKSQRGQNPPPAEPETCHVPSRRRCRWYPSRAWPDRRPSNLDDLS